MSIKRKYPAPTVSVADANGLIKTADLKNDIIVSFFILDGTFEHDSYQLLLNNELVGEPLSFLEPVPVEGTEVSLAIPVDTHLLEDGLYTVGYRVKPFPGGTTADSELITIQIDRTPPGASLLAPMLVPNITLGDTLTATLPGYAGMATGDLIQTLCNDTEGPNIIVQAEHLMTIPVTIQFERTFLQNLDSEQIEISYRVTDRAGNVSLTSQPVNLTLQV